MQKSKYDHSVFYRNSSSGIIMLVVYVDNIVITKSEYKGISSLTSFLKCQFHTKDLGMLRSFLGIEVMLRKYEMFLSQRKYVFDILSETEKLGVKPCRSPIVLGVYFTREGETFEDIKRYKRLHGKLNYLTIIHLNTVYSVGVVSQYMFAPTGNHWVVVEQILCYLKGASGQGISI